MRQLLKEEIKSVLTEKSFKNMLLESVNDKIILTPDKIANLKPNDTVIVYHGTNTRHIDDLLNGADTTKIAHRTYTSNGNRHSGLFVAPDYKTARSFGYIVIEFTTKARNLHGVNYGGNIGREQKKRGNDLEWMEMNYPNSFRPYLSYTLTQRPEPQALHVGLIRPEDIIRVKWGEEDWKLPTELEGKDAGDSYTNRKLKIRGVDLSNPNMTIPELIKAIGLSNLGKWTPEERFYKFIPARLNRFNSIEELEYALHNPGGGFGLNLGRIAAKSMAKKLWPLRN
jgi:hypothetical protein